MSHRESKKRDDTFSTERARTRKGVRGKEVLLRRPSSPPFVFKKSTSSCLRFQPTTRGIIPEKKRRRKKHKKNSNVVFFVAFDASQTPPPPAVVVVGVVLFLVASSICVANNTNNSNIYVPSSRARGTPRYPRKTSPA